MRSSSTIKIIDTMEKYPQRSQWGADTNHNESTSTNLSYRDIECFVLPEYLDNSCRLQNHIKKIEKHKKISVADFETFCEYIEPYNVEPFASLARLKKNITDNEQNNVDLMDLYVILREEVINNEINKTKKYDVITAKSSPSTKIVQLTHQFLNDFRGADLNKKVDLVNEYDKQCKKIRPICSVQTAVVAMVKIALWSLAFGVAGALVGLVATVELGPGALGGIFMGAFCGLSAGIAFGYARSLHPVDDARNKFVESTKNNFKLTK